MSEEVFSPAGGDEPLMNGSVNTSVSSSGQYIQTDLDQVDTYSRVPISTTVDSGQPSETVADDNQPSEPLVSHPDKVDNNGWSDSVASSSENLSSSKPSVKPLWKSKMATYHVSKGYAGKSNLYSGKPSLTPRHKTKPKNGLVKVHSLDVKDMHDIADDLALNSSNDSLTASSVPESGNSPARQMSTSPTRQMLTSPTRQMSTSPPRQMSTSSTRQMSTSPTRQMSNSSTRQLTTSPTRQLITGLAYHETVLANEPIDSKGGDNKSYVLARMKDSPCFTADSPTLHTDILPSSSQSLSSDDVSLTDVHVLSPLTERTTPISMSSFDNQTDPPSLMCSDITVVPAPLVESHEFEYDMSALSTVPYAPAEFAGDADVSVYTGLWKGISGSLNSRPAFIETVIYLLSVSTNILYREDVDTAYPHLKTLLLQDIVQPLRR